MRASELQKTMLRRCGCECTCCVRVGGGWVCWWMNTTDVMCVCVCVSVCRLGSDVNEMNEIPVHLASHQRLVGACWGLVLCRTSILALQHAARVFWTASSRERGVVVVVTTTVQHSERLQVKKVHFRFGFSSWVSHTF